MKNLYRKEGKINVGNRRRICTNRDRKTANTLNRRINKGIIQCELKNLEKSI